MIIHEITHWKYSDRTVRVALARLNESRYFMVTVTRKDGSFIWPHIYCVPEGKYDYCVINNNGLEGIIIPVDDLEGMIAYEKKASKEESVSQIVGKEQTS